MKREITILFIISNSFWILSCDESSQKFVDLSGDYWFVNGGHSSREIESKKSYKNKIYPDIINYSYNRQFIVAEQKPNKEQYLFSLGEDLLRRFQAYRMYQKDTTILQDTFYRKLRGSVEKDSVLCNMFLKYGASDDEYKNRTISITYAEQLIVNDPYHSKILSNTLNYWIIQISADTLIGPLNLEEYLTKRKILRIPVDVQLNIEKSRTY